MQTDESRQGVLTAVKLNLTVAKIILATAREKLVAEVNLRIKGKLE